MSRMLVRVGRVLPAFLPVLLPALLSAPPEGAAPRAAVGRVEGRVRDAGGRPIANAQVFLVGAAASATADSAGHYLLARVPAGRVTLRAAFVGYRPVQLEGLLVRANRTVTQDFVLEKTVARLEEVQVIRAPGALAPRDEVSVRGGRRELSTNGLEEATTSPAAASAEFGHAQRGVVVLQRPAAAPEFDTEEYHRLEDNRFLSVAGNPLSTFSIDVDRASYANVRRFLTEGRLPPADAVRIEELVNYFPYRYAAPAGEDPVRITTDLARAPWNPRHALVRIGLQAERIETAALPPSNLVFLLDVSGSMDEPAKLPLVKQAFRLLVDELRPQDRVAIVVYAGAAGLVLPSTPGNRKQEILDAIARLEAGGSTAGGAGIQLAYDVAKANFVRGGNNRVILATDGDFNVGASSEGELVRMIEQRREEGTYLTVLGFGTGNYKDARMEQLADKGNGNYAYVDNLLEARKVFVQELGATLHTVAKDVKLQVEFNPARVQAYRLIGYENRLLAKEDFNDDAKDAGEMGAGHTVTALYELVPAGLPSDVALRGTDSLRYQRGADPRPNGQTATRDEWLTVKLRYKPPTGGASRLLVHPVAVPDAPSAGPAGDFAWAAAVADFGMVLRASPDRGSASLEQVLALARAARGDDPDGYRAEFIRLVEVAQTLALQASGPRRPE